MIVIGDDNYQDFLPGGLKSPLRHHYGLTPRDYTRDPVGSSEYAQPFDEVFPLIPREEWPERIADMKGTKSRLSDIYRQEALDQNGQGFCWAYSSAACWHALNALAGGEPTRLSPHAIACIIYNYQDRGAWGKVSFDYMVKNGCPSEEYWPQQSMRRSNDTPEMRADMAKHRFTEGYVDLNPPHPADANLTEDQQMSVLLSGLPMVGDHNWWGHSICQLDAVDMNPSLGQQGLNDPNRWGRLIINSWGRSWSENGFGILKGRKGIADGGLAPRAITIVGS
jgi:hypothetical protein